MFTKPVVQSLIAVFALSWLFGIAFAVMGLKLGDGIIGIAFPMLYMFLPLIATYIVFKNSADVNFKETIGLKWTWNRYFVLAWFSPILFSFIILGINLLFPDVTFSHEMHGFLERLKSTMSEEEYAQMLQKMESMPLHPGFISVLSAIPAAITINAFFAFGEEAFWRGYLYKLLESHGFWKLSLFTGFVWGLWHAPIIMMGHNYPSYPYIGVGMMIIWTMLLTPMFTYIRQKSDSVLAPAIMHGSLNASAGIPLVFLVGGGELINGWLGLAGFIALLGVNAVLYLVLRDKGNK